MSVVSCPPQWVNTLKAINQRARLFSAAVMLRPSMFCVFMVAGGLLFCTACCYLRKSCAHGVLGAVEKRPAIYTTCMLCYRKERLSSLYSDKHTTHPALAPCMYCIVYQCPTEWGCSTVQCLLYCVFMVLSRRSCWLSRLSIAVPHTRFVLSIAGVTIHHLLLMVVLPHRMHLCQSSLAYFTN